MKKLNLYDYFGLDAKKEAKLLPMGIFAKIANIFEKRQDKVRGDFYIYNSDNLDDKRPAMLIFPGGGYWGTSHNEWENIADAYAEKGFRTFVVDYSVRYFKYPTQLNEAIMAMIYLRKNKDELGITDNIAVCGFSAGGHLAGSISNLYNDKTANQNLLRLGYNTRPDASVLCYPVISSDDKISHKGSFNNLCGFDKELKKYVSLETQVDKNTPPAFLWHTREDTCVPFQNSVRYDDALAKNGIKHKLCLYQVGKHGLNLAKGYEAEAWFEESVNFLKELGF